MYEWKVPSFVFISSYVNNDKSYDMITFSLVF